MKQGHRDDDVTAILQSSVVIGWVARLLASVPRAALSSRLLSPIRRASEMWQTSLLPSRQLAVGIALLSGSTTHLALSMLGRPASGWLWLVIPLAAAAFGLLLIASGRPRTRHDAHS
jgi:hypothetical protein